MGSKSNSRTDSTQNQSDNKDNTGGINATGSTVNDNVLNIMQTDFGAIEAGKEVSKLALEASQEVLESGIKANSYALQDSLDFALDSTNNALDLVADGVILSTNFAENAQDRALDTVDRTNDLAFRSFEYNLDNSLSFAENINADALNFGKEALDNSSENLRGIVQTLENSFNFSRDAQRDSIQFAEEALSNASVGIGTASDNVSKGFEFFADRLEKNNSTELKNLIDQIKPVAYAAAAAFTVSKIIQAMK
jgi:hypothetical protein